MEIVIAKARPGKRDEEGRCARLRAELVATLGVAAKRRSGAVMDQHLAGLAELRAPHDEDPLVEVDVVPVQPQGLADPHSRRVEQPDEG